eukprot:4302822-Prymnesium_polylepis.1
MSLPTICMLHLERGERAHEHVCSRSQTGFDTSCRRQCDPAAAGGGANRQTTRPAAGAVS